MVFLPTTIYIKTCKHCNLKYLGKTQQKDVYKYKGSGTYWKAHIKKHKSIIHTRILGYFLNKESCREFCIWYSNINNIVKSEKWANLIIENGLDGANIGNTFNIGRVCKEETKLKIKQSNIKHFIKNPRGKMKEEIKKKISKTMLGIKKYPFTKEHRINIGKARLGKKLTEETKLKLHLIKTGKIFNKIQCPHCDKIGGSNCMKRWHFNNCKLI